MPASSACSGGGRGGGGGGGIVTFIVEQAVKDSVGCLLLDVCRRICEFMSLCSFAALAESAKTWVLAYLAAVDYERDLGGNVMFGTLTSSKGQTIVVLNIYGEG